MRELPFNASIKVLGGVSEIKPWPYYTPTSTLSYSRYEFIQQASAIAIEQLEHETNERCLSRLAQ
jgi:hypothetical protein